jgi:4-diphosphocytidyl-2-C-methyl-D-erythritol kinase
VGAKRADGYHDIYSWFLPLPLHDALEVVVTPNQAEPISWQQTGLYIPGDISSNLALQAVALFRKYTAVPNISVHLHKQIPMGAGLGGGSADAAWMLLLLNQLLGTSLTQEQLATFALELGSDCPFFIYNQPMQVSGRGDIMKPVSLSLKGKYYILIDSGIHIGTAEAYQHIQRSGKVLPEVLPENIYEWKELLFNDFEGYAFQKHPELHVYKEKLYQSGAFYASMTGSGSALYGLFDGPPPVADFRPLKIFSGVF